MILEKFFKSKIESQINDLLSRPPKDLARMIEKIPGVEKVRITSNSDKLVLSDNLSIEIHTSSELFVVNINTYKIGKKI